MRQIRLLENDHELTVLGHGPAPDTQATYQEVVRTPWNGVRKVQMASLLLLGAANHVYWSRPEVAQVKALLGGKKFELILANDLSTLPLSITLKGNAPVLFDAHEYSPQEFEDKKFWGPILGDYSHFLCQKYLPQVSGMITVGRCIAEEYNKKFGVCARVVHNAPSHQDLSPSELDGNRIRLIHHGAAMRARYLESMIDMMKHLDGRFTLDLMLMKSDERYFTALRGRAAGDPRIRFIEPVPMPKICHTINQYDLGIYILPPNSLNSRYALPNKFFEYIQARLGIAIGPSPEMASLVDRYQCGVVAESFRPEALAARLMLLDKKKVQAYKQASHRAARELNFENGSKVLLEEIERLLSAQQHTIG